MKRFSFALRRGVKGLRCFCPNAEESEDADAYAKEKENDGVVGDWQELSSAGAGAGAVQ
jgi:hypothetical protein